MQGDLSLRSPSQKSDHKKGPGPEFEELQRKV